MRRRRWRWLGEAGVAAKAGKRAAVKVATAEHRVSVTYGFVPEMQIRFMESKPAKTL